MEVKILIVFLSEISFDRCQKAAGGLLLSQMLPVDPRWERKRGLESIIDTMNG